MVLRTTVTQPTFFRGPDSLYVSAADYVRLLKYGDSLYRCKELKRAALVRTGLHQCHNLAGGVHGWLCKGFNWTAGSVTI